MTTKTNGTNGHSNGATADPVLVVLQLSGGNDFMNTVIPYGDGQYYDYRPNTGIAEDQVLDIDGSFGFHPAMGPVKDLYDSGNVAIIQGIGYPEPDRSHFRSMDIWHTAEPTKFSSEGWLGRAIRVLDPASKNVVTGVSFGQGLPRAMVAPGTPVIAVAQLENYGLLTTLPGKRQRKAVATFERMYAPEETAEASMILNHLGETGQYALEGASLLRSAPERYTSNVEYAGDQLSQSLRGIAQVHLAGLGTRIFYANIGGFDVHALENKVQPTLWENVSRSVTDFFADLREHGAADNVTMMIFSEFGRRIKDNGGGTDHGSGGGAFLVGDHVGGGLYGQYPSLDPDKQLDGDLHFNNDFRSLYSSVLDQWMDMSPAPIVNGTFDQFEGIIKKPVAA